MNLLVLTQKVDANDDVLGFFHEWLRRLAGHFEHIEVICLYEGTHQLPKNVSVYSLRKEKGYGRLKRTVKFFSYIWSLPYDRVFVHMNPEYVVLGGWWWRLTGKRIVLWYAHRSVDLKLRIAAFFSNAIASSAAESFRLHTSKLRVLGHGIDTDYFKPVEPAQSLRNPLQLISVGRITPIKKLLAAIEVLALLRKKRLDAVLELVGAPTNASDRVYEMQLRERARVLRIEEAVVFTGAVPYKEIVKKYQNSDFSINLAPSGGLDKAVLEGMACGLPTFVSNKGFSDVLEEKRGRLMFALDNASELADKIEALASASDLTDLRQWVRMRAVEFAGLDAFMIKLTGLLK